MMRILFAILALLATAATGAAAHAGEADVVDVSVQATGEGIYRFSVTVRHDDAGWEHYADRWQIIGPDGMLLGERVLLHPHDTEQPFTRSLSGVAIGAEVEAVTVRAGDLVHGFGGREAIVKLPRTGG